MGVVIRTNYHGTTAICLVKFSQNKRNCHCNLYCPVSKHQGGNTIKEEQIFCCVPSLSIFCQFNLSMRNRSDDLVQLQPASYL